MRDKINYISLNNKDFILKNILLNPLGPPTSDWFLVFQIKLEQWRSRKKRILFANKWVGCFAGILYIYIYFIILHTLINGRRTLYNSLTVPYIHILLGQLRIFNILISLSPYHSSSFHSIQSPLSIISIINTLSPIYLPCNSL